MADCAKPYYCNEADAYPTANDCDTQDGYLSGWSAVTLVQCGTDITDPSDGAALETLRTEGKLTTINNIKGGLDEPSEITTDSRTSCGTTNTINYDRTFTFQDFKVGKAVVEWYNETKKLSFGGALLWGCDGTVTYINKELKLVAALSGENNNGVEKFITAVLRWRDIDDPVPYTAPDSFTP